MPNRARIEDAYFPPQLTLAIAVAFRFRSCGRLSRPATASKHVKSHQLTTNTESASYNFPFVNKQAPKAKYAA